MYRDSTMQLGQPIAMRSELCLEPPPEPSHGTSRTLRFRANTNLMEGQ